MQAHRILIRWILNPWQGRANTLRRKHRPCDSHATDGHRGGKTTATQRPPKGPKGHPLLGHLSHIRHDPLGFFTSCTQRYGDFVPLRLGPLRAILISNPDYVESILLQHPHDYIKSAQFRAARAILGQGLILAEGDAWMRSRRLMQPAFHRERIAAYADTMASFAREMVDRLEDGAMYDMHTELLTLTMAVVAKTLFDVDLGAEREVLASLAKRAVDAFERKADTVWLFLPDSIPAPTNMRLRRAGQELDDAMLRFIGERRRDGEDRGDLLSMLIQAEDETDGTGMTDREVRDEAITIFMAGHETTATTLAWALFLLSQHPEVEARVVQEIEEALQGRLPRASDLSALKYTEMMVMETLRLYPSVGVLGREPLDDCQIGEHDVRKGTTLILSTWTIHRDARYFDNPEAFRPDRWENDFARKLPRFAYFPFGGGPRQCIGQGFAMMEIVLLLATLLQGFSFETTLGQDVAPLMSITIRPREGLKMIAKRRGSDIRQG